MGRPIVEWALHDACATLDTDPAVRAVILRGAGDKAFASGTDIRQFLDFETRQDALDYEARLTRVLSKLAGMSKPTIAMLQGDAIGGGLFIALGVLAGRKFGTISEMRQNMWGKAFPAFDAKHAYSVQYQVSQNIDFDLCIDDVFLVR